MSTATLKQMSLKDFVQNNISELREKINKKTQLIWSRRTYEDLYPKYNQKLYPLEAQKRIIGQMVDGILENRIAFLSGEMGTGKTLMAIYTMAVLQKKKNKNIRILVITPPNIMENPWKTHIEKIIPDARVKIVGSLREFLNLKKEPKTPKNKLEFWIVSETMWKGIADKEKESYYSKIKIKNKNEERIVNTIACPHCNRFKALDASENRKRMNYVIFNKYIAQIHKNEDILQISNQLKQIEIAPDSGTVSVKLGKLKVYTRELHECPECKSLFIDKKIKKYPLADIYKDYLKSYFQFAIIDEGSMYRNLSKRGLTLGKIKCPTLVLSGTFMTGYASSLFYINMQLLGRIWRKRGFNFKSERTFQEIYGFVKKSVVNQKRTKIGYAPGVKPELVAIMRRYTSFISLSDVVEKLPKYTEIYVPVKSDEKAKEAYRDFVKQIKKIENQAGLVINALAFPDLLYQTNTYGENQIVTEPVYQENELLPKEAKLIEIIRKEKKEGRKCLIYPIFTQRRDVSDRLLDILKTHDITVKFLKDNIPPEKREEYLVNLSKDVDAVIVQPKKVQYGANLQPYPTIIWYQPTYDPDLFKQASRRSFRADQTKEVRVYQLYYENTIQESAFELVNEKDAVMDLFNGILNDKLDFALKTKNSVIAQLYKKLIEESEI